MTQAGYFETRRFNPASLAMAAAIEFALIASAVAWQIDVIPKSDPPIVVNTIPVPDDPPPIATIPDPARPRTDRTKQNPYVPPTETGLPLDETGPAGTTTVTPPIPDLPRIDPIPLDPPRILEPARAKGSIQSLITSDDYPESARRREETGAVRARLDIGVSGKVTGCTVVDSSGSPTLDSTTCRLLTARARFAPAKDRNGELVSDTYLTKIVWIIKQDG